MAGLGLGAISGELSSMIQPVGVCKYLWHSRWDRAEIIESSSGSVSSLLGGVCVCASVMAKAVSNDVSKVCAAKRFFGRFRSGSTSTIEATHTQLQEGSWVGAGRWF